MSGPRPAFGRHMLELWALDPSLVYLNHGTVGAPPKRVLQAQQAIRDEIERDPARFLLRELADIGDDLPRAARPRLRAAAERVAEFVSAEGPDLVFTDNATTAANAVLRSLKLERGDEIVITDLAYGAIGNATRFVAEGAGAVVRLLTVPYPFTPESVVEHVRAWMK